VRKSQKKRLKDACAESGLSRSMFNYIENGARTPSVKAAKRIAAVFGFDWTEFYKDD
jgi:transcriptional regulator with XRE-family HTH domain